VRAALAAAAIVLSSAGCGSEGETDEPAARSCGSYENAHEPPSAEQREGNRCVLDAMAADEAARLVVTRTTIEGDPIVTTISVHARDRVELVVDGTQDRFGDGSVETLECTGLRELDGFLEGTGCEAAG
jgi:hypothetical protein